MSTASETRLRRGDEGGASGAGDVVEGVWLSQADPVGAWLDVLMGLVRLGSAEKRAIRDELDSHLRDRVRDLMLTGLREQIATREAIGELGDAAELAARYARASRSPARRRIAMNMGLFGMAGAALVTSFVAMQQPGGSGSRDQSGLAGMSVYAGTGAGVDDEAVKVGSVSVDDTPLAEVLRQVAKSADKRLLVDWPSLGGLGFESVTPISVDVPDADLPTLFSAIRAVAEVDPQIGRLEYRVDDTTLRVASGHAFDMQERILVTIDIAHVIEEGVGEDQIRDLVISFIEPDGWVDNGGEIAAMSIVGTKLFVKAPPRVIEGVRWIVGQFAVPAGAQGQGGGGGEGVTALGADEYVRVFKLSHVSAATMLAAIEPIYAAVAERTDPEAARLRFTADKENPVIVVRGPKRLVEEACAVMSDMDAAKETGQVQSSQVQPGPKAIDSRLILLKNVGAMEMAEVLRAAGSVSERLRKGPPERAIAVDAGSNGLYVRSTAEQIDAIAEIVGAFDTDGPLDDRAIEESRTIKLERARAAELRQVLGLVLNANVRMKQCLVPRSFEVDASENTLTVTATPGQVDAITRMVSALDAGL